VYTCVRICVLPAKSTLPAVSATVDTASPGLKYWNVVVPVTVTVTLVALNVSPAVDVKSRTDIILPVLKLCAVPVVIVAVLPESRAYDAVLVTLNDAADVVGTVVGNGSPRL